MGFGRAQNRRRSDAAKVAGGARAAFRRYGILVLRLAIGASLSAGLVFGAHRAYGWLHTSPFFALDGISFGGLSRANEAELLAGHCFSVSGILPQTAGLFIKTPVVGPEGSDLGLQLGLLLLKLQPAESPGPVQENEPDADPGADQEVPFRVHLAPA